MEAVRNFALENYKDGYAVGRAEGLVEGFIEGYAEGFIEGYVEGRAEGAREVAAAYAELLDKMAGTEFSQQVHDKLMARLQRFVEQFK